METLNRRVGLSYRGLTFTVFVVDSDKLNIK